ncbi:MAG: cobyric acid synthase, partial [Spirochaetes bacterium]|nr:cobyric acid synthase [Spirochaetota bacterium]
ASANLNPLGPPEWLDAAFAEGRRACGRYPDPSCRELRAAAASSLGVPPECLVFGNGADELMFALARSLARRPLGSSPRAPTGAPTTASSAAPTGDPRHDAADRPVHLVEAPSYASYRASALDAGLKVGELPARLPGLARAPGSEGASEGSEPRDRSPRESAPRDAEFYRASLAASPPGSALWIGAPSNPTGLMPGGYPGLAGDLARAFPDRIVVCDEAFIEFADGADPAGALALAASLPNLVVLRSMTKFWAVPGLRAGYAVAGPAIAAALRAALPNWPLNSVAEAFARLAFSSPGSAERRDATRAFVSAERSRMAARLGALPGLEVLESSANYYLVLVRSEAEPALDGDGLAARLAKKGIGVRKCRNFAGLGSEYLRVAVRTAPENDAIAEAFAEALGRPAADDDRGLEPGPAARAAPEKRKPARAKALSIQGCSSSAGKSLIAAAFCRIFRDEGLDVAPYKAQNMSLNSAVTPDGLEIGRAQAVQAAACGLEPDARMNPVLLKPESDAGSQVVLMGRPYARYKAREYYDLHATMRDAARSAYDSLALEREIIVLEGAGSPGEINLKSRDFVNMGAARHAGARVLLVGDIDRGGVFASFIGHVATFAPDELAMLSGFIVNKFRGDPALLGDAFGMTRARTGYPVLGCVPMIAGLDIPDEDEPVVKAGAREGAELRIAVPRLRRVSNFTDLDAFASEPDATVVPVSSGKEIDDGRFDAVVIPGTKSTVADLGWLRETGLADSILRFAASGGTVAGICGGYQMLGRAVLDPDGVESDERETPGLGLIPVVTSFAADKTLSRTAARWVPSGEALSGYEIHHGVTRLARDDDPRRGQAAREQARAVVVSESGEVLGYGAGEAWGSYLHGVFDADGFRRSFLNGLRRRRGLPPLPPSPRASLDSELSRLAEAVKANVDMGA